MTVIRLTKSGTGWDATFRGGNMPQGIPLPLPFTAQAPSEMVVADLRTRFPGAVFQIAAHAKG